MRCNIRAGLERRKPLKWWETTGTEREEGLADFFPIRRVSRHALFEWTLESDTVEGQSLENPKRGCLIKHIKPLMSISGKKASRMEGGLISSIEEYRHYNRVSLKAHRINR